MAGNDEGARLLKDLEINNIKREKKALQEEKDEVEEKLSIIEEDVAQLKKENDTLRSKQSTFEKKIQTLQHENEELKHRQEIYEHEKKDIKLRADAAESLAVETARISKGPDLADIVTEAQKHLDAKIDGSKKLNAENKEIFRKMGDMQQLKSDVQTLGQANELYRLKNQKLENENLEHKQNETWYKSRVQELEVKIAELEAKDRPNASSRSLASRSLLGANIFGRSRPDSSEQPDLYLPERSQSVPAEKRPLSKGSMVNQDDPLKAMKTGSAIHAGAAGGRPIVPRKIIADIEMDVPIRAGSNGSHNADINPSFGSTIGSFGRTSASLGDTTASSRRRGTSFENAATSSERPRTSFGRPHAAFEGTSASFGGASTTFGRAGASFGGSIPSFGGPGRIDAISPFPLVRGTSGRGGATPNVLPAAPGSSGVVPTFGAGFPSVGASLTSIGAGPFSVRASPFSVGSGPSAAGGLSGATSSPDASGVDSSANQPVSEDPGFKVAITPNDGKKAELMDSSQISERLHRHLNWWSPKWQKSSQQATLNKKPKLTDSEWHWGRNLKSTQCLRARGARESSSFRGTDDNADMVACTKCVSECKPCFRLMPKNQLIAYGLKASVRQWVLLPLPADERLGLKPEDDGYWIKGGVPEEDQLI